MIQRKASGFYDEDITNDVLQFRPNDRKYNIFIMYVPVVDIHL